MFGPLGDPSGPPSFYGMNVHVSDMAVVERPKRLHKKRRNQTQQYHDRVQKKWRKRWGVVLNPCAYQSELYGLIMHPTLFEAMKRQLRT